jgi:hypothetical protein
MRKLFLLMLFPMLPLSARAEIVVVTPGVTVRVGRPGVVVAPRSLPVPIVVPFPNRSLPPASPVMPPAPPIEPGDPPPVPPDGAPRVVIPAPASTPSVTPPPAGLVPTVTEFAASFRPRPGKNEVLVRHPFTNTVVRFALDLPDGSPRMIRVNRRVLEFDYGRRTVVVRFFHDGSVQVRN